MSHLLETSSNGASSTPVGHGANSTSFAEIFYDFVWWTLFAAFLSHTRNRIVVSAIRTNRCTSESSRSSSDACTGEDLLDLVRRVFVISCIKFLCVTFEVYRNVLVFFKFIIFLDGYAHGKASVEEAVLAGVRPHNHGERTGTCDLTTRRRGRDREDGEMLLKQCSPISCERPTQLSAEVSAQSYAFVKCECKEEVDRFNISPTVSNQFTTPSTVEMPYQTAFAQYDVLHPYQDVSAYNDLGASQNGEEARSPRSSPAVPDQVSAWAGDETSEPATFAQDDALRSPVHTPAKDETPCPATSVQDGTLRPLVLAPARDETPVAAKLVQDDTFPSQPFTSGRIEMPYPSLLFQDDMYQPKNSASRADSISKQACVHAMHTVNADSMKDNTKANTAEGACSSSIQCSLDLQTEPSSVDACLARGLRRFLKEESSQKFKISGEPLFATELPDIEGKRVQCDFSFEPSISAPSQDASNHGKVQVEDITNENIEEDLTPTATGHWSGLPVQSAPAHGLKVRLPGLPSAAHGRLHSPDCSELEREIYELFLRFKHHVETVGFSSDDLNGPRSFPVVCEDLRIRVEESHANAEEHWRVARRLASSDDMPVDRGVKILYQAEKRFEMKTMAARAYRIVQHLWTRCQDLCRRGLEEELEVRQYKQIVGEQGESQHVRRSSVDLKAHPCFGVFEPLPVESLPARTRPATLSAESEGFRRREWELEHQYDDMQRKCAEGRLSVVDCWYFIRLVSRERCVLRKLPPSRERVWRMAAFNRVVACWGTSFVAIEADAHRKHLIKHGKVLQRVGAPQVPGAHEQLVQLHRELSHCPDPEECSVPASASAGDIAEPLANELDPVGMELSDHPPEASSGMGDCSEAPRMDSSGLFRADEDEFNDLTGFCVVCLERPATQVGKACGHLVYCKSCQRKAVLRFLKQASGRWSTGARPHGVNKKEFERTRLVCPLCRTEAVMVAQESFTGTVYIG